MNWVGARNISLTWENGRQLKQYKQGSSKQYDYTYNADGLRTGKTVKEGSTTTTTEYYIVNGTYLGEVKNIGGTQYVISYFYDENGSPAGIYVGDAPYYFAKNMQGDVTSLIDYEGTVVARYVYDAWGNIIAVYDEYGDNVTSSTHIALLNPFRYRGYMYDDETGFYYLRSRYYDPEVGRFLNADGVVNGEADSVEGYNLFVYCFNNPVNLDDASGNWPKWLKKAVNVFCKTVETAITLALAPIEAIHVSIGVGTGIGASVAPQALGGAVEVGLVSKVSVSAESDGTRALNFKYTEGISAGVKLSEKIEWSMYCDGKEHSLLDTNCICTLEEFGSDCPANTPIDNSISTTIGFSADFYCIIGGEFSIYFDPVDWSKENYNILIDYANVLEREGVIRKLD